MLGEHARRLGEVLSIVRNPGQVELGLGYFDGAAEVVNGGLHEIQSVNRVLRVLRDLAQRDERLRREVTVGERAADLFGSRTRLFPLTCTTIRLREIEERFGSSFSGGYRHGS